MIKLIKQDKYLIFTLISVFCAVGWFLNFKIWQICWPYFLFSIFYFLINSIWLGKILARPLNLEKELRFFFGLFLLLFLIAFGMAVPIFFYRVTPVWLFGSLLFLTIFISILNHLRYFNEEPDADFQKLEDRRGIQISKIFYFLFSIFYFLALWFLFRSRTGNFILSPWEAIKPYYLYLWFGIAFITGLFIFSKEKIWKILLIIILTSLLLHAYLPITYETGFGGDKWRHLGAERWLMEGKIYSPALFGEPLSWKQIGPIKIPEIFIVGNKNSYVNMWGLTIALSWLLNIDVFWIDLLLGYLLYSILFPLLMFKLAQFFNKEKFFLLLFSFLPLLFYPFQAYGSITVPVSFGFLWFIFVLFFIFKFVSQSISKHFFLILVALLLINYFNYILYAIILLEILTLSLIFKGISQTKGQSRILLIILAIICFLVFTITIPYFDTVNEYSNFKIDYMKGWWQVFKEAITDFSKKIIISWPIFYRYAFMEQDNILFMQPQIFFNRASFLRLIPWPYFLTPLVLLISLVGVLKIKKSSQPMLAWLCLVVLIIFLANQFIASYFMTGNHIFSKRLVLAIAFFVLPFVAFGLYQFVTCRFWAHQTKVICVVLFLILTLITVYASGPKMQVVTKNELLAAKYLWKKIKTQILNTQSPNYRYCVLANTWPLLALEAESNRQIVAGGFPFYFEYRQPERVQLFANMNKNPSIRDIKQALAITGAKTCYFMTEERWIDPFRKNQVINQLNKIFGQPEKIGDVYIWHYQF